MNHASLGQSSAPKALTLLEQASGRLEEARGRLRNSTRRVHDLADQAFGSTPAPISGQVDRDDTLRAPVSAEIERLIDSINDLETAIDRFNS